MEELKEEFQERILFGFLEGIWCLDIIYQGQRPLPSVNIEEEEEQCEDVELKSTEAEEQTKEQENYKRDFFAMLEDVIELSNENPSVLIDPEFSIANNNNNC